jgi:ATP-dependent helicase YprA (DUF1998 family)
MIPSLVARELKGSIVEYLATTFALSDDEAYQALTEFLLDEHDGIFRGPYLRVRLPFVDAPAGADLGVAWVPAGFQPYAHQLTAWQRLAGRGRLPKPTLVTTGTGSGKSEAFLIPAIDHAIWARGQGRRGIKALVLYPMNALVTDQERRIAVLLTDPAARAAGVRGGVWIGDDGSVRPRREMDGTHLISDPAALQEDPPDILLTNYKMLDRLLTNASRQRLWAANTRPADDDGTWEQPLTYLVLDEFHTYDGAQGTDVAMLLRRLGHRLGTATTTSPLGGIGCVGTSATLGSSPTAAKDMCSFASRVFGVRFDATAVIGEQRRTVAEVCGDIDFSLPVPEPGELVALDPRDLDALAEAFTGSEFDDAQAVGDRLLRHRVTASLLRVAADRPRRWPDAVVGIAQQVPEWGAAMARDTEVVEHALERFVALVSQARGRTSNGGIRPLFAVEVQVWIREVTRLKRTVSRTPGFRWADSPTEDHASLDLPSVYCTSCGRSGWLAVANRAGGQGAAAIERLVYDDDTDPYQVSVRDRERTRTMLRANSDEPEVLWLDPHTGQVHSADAAEETRIPVLVAGMTGDDRSEVARNEAAKRQQCPSCGSRDAIRFLGSRVTTLASVGITQMFGSDHVADDERKLLAFTDSVQDASHRAAFFSGRTHRFNLRATLSAALQSKGRVPLPRVAEVVLSRADNSDHPLDDIFSLVPPDLLWEGWLAAAWESPGTPAADEARDGLAQRLAFDAVLEAGLRSRFGRTLETTGTAVAEILVTDDEWREVTAFATEAIQASTGQLIMEPDDVRTWVAGVLQRLRLRGGIFHSFLDRYLADHGKRWWIWGGGDPLAPKFPKGISAPAFFASTASDDLDPIAGNQSWLRLWSQKVLGIDGAGADQAMRDLLHILSDVGVIQHRSTSKGTVWGLPGDRIEFVDIAPVDGTFPGTELRCALCAHRHHTTPERFEEWNGRPCLRLRCPGRYEPAATPPTNYYRHLYRSGRIRRVVAAEHTGMLSRQRRERVETGFKDGGRPDAPNVLAATPTLEMGIDIGDLSAVMLTAVPPSQTNYVQRVGRAGRKTGNAFVTTFAEGDPRSLYFLHDPELMIAGDIVAPSCYLDAIEILRRQYLAFLVDQAAQGAGGLVPAAGDMPRTIGQLAASGLQPGGWLTTILDVGKAPDLVARFITLFGQHLDPAVAARLASWAATDMRPHVERVVDRWRAHIQTLTNQRDRLREREKPFAELEHPTSEDVETLGRIVSELRYVAGRIIRAKSQDTLGALEALGLLPNYTLFDDTVTLEVSLWRPNDAHDPGDEQSRRFISDGAEYARPASISIRELAPGNYFYVDAHRVRIDAVDNGTEHEPAHALWRFCPTCAWATTDATAAVGTCPRCGAAGVADQGALVTVLPMRVVSSTERETAARVGDDTEDRDREWHEVLTSVDIAPDDITAAHLHTKTVFGIEAARAARIRYLNLGLHASRAGQTRQIRVDGYDAAASLFRVCRHCGGVFGIRGDTRDDHDPNHHRSWCKVRSGARKEQWDQLVLAHELVTEAVRILLPVAEFEAQERVLSFKAALLLGLRDSFGGDPSHLRVLQTDFPAPGGDPDARNRFVVVHDTVPGGTGYLPRLADPDRLRKILTRAVELITTCECQTRGQPGCHRCLYTATGRHEIPLVTREVALDVLDEILTGWQLNPAEHGTITGVNLSAVRQSELERMFKALLHRWSTDGPARVTAKPDPDHASLTRFDVRFQDGPHWELREQVNLVQHGTRPDFYATRVDATGTPPVAIYLDGWEYHGNEPGQVDLDSSRRASVRAGGTIVWALTWQDVKAALTAASHGSTVPASLPLANPVRHNAVHGAKQVNGGPHPAFDALTRGAFDQLMLLLAHPDPTAWRHLAMTTALAAGSAGTSLPVTSAAGAIEQAARHLPIAPADHDTGIAALTWTTLNGQPAATVLERDGSPLPSAVLSHDTGARPDKARWTDWLHIGNLLQHLGDHAVIATTRTYTRDTSSPEAAAVTATVPGAEELLADVFDPAAVPFAEAAISAGWDQLVVGYPSGDPDDTPIEVAWPAQRVGILPTGGSRPSTLTDWDLRTADQWTAPALLAALDGAAT